MANKTLIPAIKAHVGDWNYYICSMRYAEVARSVAFAYELNTRTNSELAEMIQRGISARTIEIKDYLLRSPHRFLGAMIVACWGGDPHYVPVKMEDSEGMLSNLDSGFGVLTFDGTQQYFALDGQHRLRAIKDAIKENPSLGSEEVCVLLVSHFDTEEGKLRTRRLFTNINRNARKTTKSEDIALDEDDGFAILTRRMVEEHDFLSGDGVVHVFSRIGADGEVVLAGSSIAKTNPKALTTISVLYELLKTLGSNTEFAAHSHRPSDEQLELAYHTLCDRVEDLLEHCGDIRRKLVAAKSARDVRAPKDRESDGHPFMRPVVQRAVVSALMFGLKQGAAPWETMMDRLDKLDWHIGQAPWVAVFEPVKGRMITGKDFTDLLEQLLRAHLCPSSKESIRRARKNFKELRMSSYPISEEYMFAALDEDAE